MAGLLIFMFVTGSLARYKEMDLFSLEIAPSQNAILPGVAVWKPGAPVFVIVTIKNNSRRVLHFALSNSAFDYRTEVRDTRGMLVRETEYLRKLKEDLKNGLPMTTRNILVTLKPQETCQDTIEVSSLYEVSPPGAYTVQVERDLPPELGKGVVKSNTIIATITQ